VNGADCYKKDTKITSDQSTTPEFIVVGSPIEYRGQLNNGHIGRGGVLRGTMAFCKAGTKCEHPKCNVIVRECV
jgi:hypothetical protein